MYSFYNRIYVPLQSWHCIYLAPIGFLSYRKDDTILTFAYVKHDVENGDPSSLKLVQPKLYNPEAKTDTLFLIYEKGNIKDSKSSDYISFKLPQYPSDTDINVVVRYNAERFYTI